MTMESDSSGEMHRLPFREPSFNDEMAERLLSGHIPASDASHPYHGLASLFETVAGSPIPEETAHKVGVVAAALAALEATTPVHSSATASQTQISRRRSMLSKLLTAKAATAATIAALGLGTAAAAATGSLPMQSSHANSHASAGLAIAASSASGSNTNGNSTGHGKNSASPNSTGAANNPNAQFGLCTAFMAHHPMGTTLSSVPSDSSKTFSALITLKGGLSGTQGYCEGVVTSGHASVNAGTDQNGQTGDTGNKPSSPGSQSDNAGQPSTTPPVATPNSGGTGTADTASGNASTNGTGTAATSSSGASTSGSGNPSGH
ncbi:MAG TPA: hypothetical protein VNF71_14000 [Acidimicrobiales bacterium]|nr:hypothetical protein [Acidimicrobiales bacterium]